MKTTMTFKMALFILMLYSTTTFSQTGSVVQSENKKIMETKDMKTYVIEREIPGAGKLNGEELKTIAQTSCTVLKEMGPGIEWLQSYVIENKIVCIYRAESEEALREHAKKGGFPINVISLVSNTISPATAK